MKGPIGILSGLGGIGDEPGHEVGVGTEARDIIVAAHFHPRLCDGGFDVGHSIINDLWSETICLKH